MGLMLMVGVGVVMVLLVMVVVSSLLALAFFVLRRGLVDDFLLLAVRVVVGVGGSLLIFSDGDLIFFDGDLCSLARLRARAFGVSSVDSVSA